MVYINLKQEDKGCVDEYSLYNYVLDTELFVWTGGEFGIKASVISVIGYCFVSIVAIILIKKRNIIDK